MKFACSHSGINDSVVGPCPLDYSAAESRVFELLRFKLSCFEDRVHLVSKKGRHSLPVSQVEEKQLLNEKLHIPSPVILCDQEVVGFPFPFVWRFECL